MENTLKNTTGQARIYSTRALPIFAAICSAGLILALTLIFLHAKPQPVLSVIGLGEGYSLDAVIESRAGMETVSLDQPHKAFSPPYRLNASLKLPGDSYRDFAFIVNAAGSEISVITDGFHARDLVSVRMNDETVLKKIPADWSGRLQLYAALPDKKSVTACVDVAGKTNSLGLCHTITKGAS